MKIKDARNRVATVLVIIFMSISYPSLAQNLSMGQLLDLRKKSLSGAEEFLTAQGWEFLRASEPTSDKWGQATFAYDKDNMTSKAESYITYYYHFTEYFTGIKIQVNKQSKYNEYMNAIKGYKCKMISSEIKDGEIIKVYRGATTTFRIRTSTAEGVLGQQEPAWVFIIAENDQDTSFRY